MKCPFIHDIELVVVGYYALDKQVEKAHFSEEIHTCLGRLYIRV